jgi:hypothetical protein
MTIDPALSGRAAYYRRAFSRGIGFNPNAFQRALMRRAALLAAEADKVIADPCASVNDKVRVSNAANRAHEAMVDALHDKRQAKVINPFDAYAAAKAST